LSLVEFVRQFGSNAPKTKTPPELNRGGVFATAWLPVAMQAQYLSTLQPVLHVKRAHLLPLPVSADLTFPQGPSAQSGDFATPLTVSDTNLSMVAATVKYPDDLLKIGSLTGNSASCDGTFSYLFSLTSTGPIRRI